MDMDSNYSTVYTWFEKCGIISNIRTHLRQNLVNALKRKDPGLCKSREARSAKQYVYDMLVAEYLFSHNYSFTLSIFASEVPLLVNFCNSVPQRASDPDNDNDRGGGGGGGGGSAGHAKLQSDYIAHTLETLGIDPNGPEGQHIVTNYVNSEGTPLLLSILNSAASLVVDTQSPTKESSSRDKQTQASLTPEMVNGCLADATRVRAMRKRIVQEKRLYDDELRMKESRLKQQAATVKQQVDALNEQVEEAQRLMRSLTLKEKQLNEKNDNDARCILQKEMELSVKQNFLTQEANRLQRERDGYRKFESDLKKLQRELVKMQKEISQGSNQCVQSNIINRNIHVQTDLESRAIMDECKALQREKLELTNLVQEQRSRIEQITLRSVQLSRQLEEMRSLPRPAGIDVPVSVAGVAISTNTIVSESSSTEDILQDAKMRLKRLEEESSKADQYFCNFISTTS